MTVKELFEKQQTVIKNRESKKIYNNTYLKKLEDGGLGLLLHQTFVVKFYPDKIILDSGKWFTNTTRDRINSGLLGFAHIEQEKGQWFLVKQGNERIGYIDRITITDDKIIGGLSAKKIEDNLKFRKKVNNYINMYLDKFVKGELPKPSNGDCWGCLMVAKDGSQPFGENSNHIRGHVLQRYIMGSLFLRAMENNKDCLSLMAKSNIAEWLEKGKPQYCMTDQIRKALKKYLFKELSLGAI